jgi:Tol biopolymer transport system component
MITNELFERTVSNWLHADAEHRIPDHLDAVLRRTRTERQRQAWSSLERWLPMDTTFSRRFAPTYRLAGPFLVVALVLLAFLAAILVIGSQQRRLPAPYGPALPGLTAVDEGGDIFLIDPVTRQRTTIVSGPEWDTVAGFAPDGTRLAFLRRTSADSAYSSVMVADADGSDVRAVTEPTLDISSGDWSGDGLLIAFSSQNTTTAQTDDYGLTVVDVRSGTSKVLDVGLSVVDVRWLPPDGKEIVFRGQDPALSATGGQLRPLPDAVWAVRPDGGALRQLTPREGVPGETYQSPFVSPDGRLLAYQTWASLERVTRVHVQEVAGRSSRQIPSAPLREDLFVSGFSPDGRWLLLVRQRRDSDPPEFGGVTQVVLAPADASSGGTPLGPTFPFESVESLPDLAVAFTVDGSNILLLDRDQGQLWTLPIDGRPGTQEAWPSKQLPAHQRLALNH